MQIKNILDQSKTYKQQLQQLVSLFPHSYFSILKKNKNYQYLFNYIIENTQELNDPFYNISTKVYWILNDIKSFDDSRCKCHTCNKQFKYRNVGLDGYPNFCGNSNCSQLNTDVQEKSKHTCLERYGTEYTFQSEIVKISQNRLI